MRILILFCLFATLLTGNAYGQDTAGAAQPPPRLPPAAMAAAEEIQNMRPEITDDMLAQDTEAVQYSLLHIRQLYSRRKFSNSEADSATIYGWKQLRLKVLEPTAPLSTETLVNYVSGFGKLIVKSRPGGAVVELDGNKLSDKTEAVAWPSAGTYRIKLSIDGYEPIEDTCAVVEGKPTLFERTLKRLKRRPNTPSQKNRPR